MRRAIRISGGFDFETFERRKVVLNVASGGSRARGGGWHPNCPDRRWIDDAAGVVRTAWCCNGGDGSRRGSQGSNFIDSRVTRLAEIANQLAVQWQAGTF